MTNQSNRQRFRNSIIELSQRSSYIDFLEALWRLSMELVPATLYRYRGCSPRDLDNLRNEALSFSSPAKFDDDTEDAFVRADNADYDEMLELAVGVLFPWFDNLSNMSLEQCSEAFCQTFRPYDVRSDLFKGLIPNGAANQSVFLSESEKKSRIRDTVAGIRSQIEQNDICNELRRQFKVACLCANPNSPDMWENYASSGTGFQLEYKRDDLLGMGLSKINTPLLFPIIYEQSRPSMSEFAMVLACPGSGSWLQTAADPLRIFIFTNVLKTLYIKDAERFSREEEWRMILPNPTLNEASRHSPHACAPVVV